MMIGPSCRLSSVVEQLICNQPVIGSSPIVGSLCKLALFQLFWAMIGQLIARMLPNKPARQLIGASRMAQDGRL